MSIRIVTKSVYCLRYGHLSVRPFALSVGLQLGGFSWNLISGTFMKILEKVENWLKSDKNIGHFTWKSNFFNFFLNFILLFVVTFSRHKSSLFDWNCIRLSVCLPACRTISAAPHLTDLCKVWYWGFLWKCLEKFQISVAYGKDIGHFTSVPQYVLLFCRWQQITIKAFSSSEMTSGF